MSRSQDRAVPAQRTTRSLSRSSELDRSSALRLLAGSPIEEDFFRAGDAHDFSDLDDGERTAHTD